MMNLTEAQRTHLARTIAESDITDGLLENNDIDALVDLFDAWLERQQLTGAIAFVDGTLRDVSDTTKLATDRNRSVK